MIEEALVEEWVNEATQERRQGKTVVKFVRRRTYTDDPAWEPPADASH